MNYPIRAYILDLLKEKYPGKLNPNLISIRIYNTGKEIFLEKVFSSESEKIISEEMNIVADDNLIELEPNISANLFNPQLPIEENVRRFVEELNQYDIDMCFDNIFSWQNEEKNTKNQNKCS